MNVGQEKKPVSFSHFLQSRLIAFDEKTISSTIPFIDVMIPARLLNDAAYLIEWNPVQAKTLHRYLLRS